MATRAAVTSCDRVHQGPSGATAAAVASSSAVAPRPLGALVPAVFLLACSEKLSVTQTSLPRCRFLFPVGPFPAACPGRCGTGRCVGPAVRPPADTSTKSGKSPRIHMSCRMPAVLAVTSALRTPCVSTARQRNISEDLAFRTTPTGQCSCPATPAIRRPPRSACRSADEASELSLSGRAGTG